MRACRICAGPDTIESLLAIQFSRVLPARTLPLCSKHHKLMEGALREVSREKTPPVVINLSGLNLGARAQPLKTEERAYDPLVGFVVIR